MRESTEEIEYFSVFLAVVMVVIAICAGLEIGLNAKSKAMCDQEKEIEESAIKAGVGEYYLDEKHEKKFRFIPVNGSNK